MKESMPKTKIGIYAGSFDPIHNGHLAFAELAIKSGMDKVMFLVEPRPRRKQGVRALEHRIAMVQLAVKNNPKYGVIILEQARFTPQDTVPVLQARFKGAELYMMLGDDVLDHLVAYIAGWPNIDHLANDMIFVVAARNKKAADIKASFTTLQKISGCKFRYQIIADKLPDISSTKIRPALRKGLQPEGIPQKVWDYIQSHQLYSSADASK